MTLVPTEDDLAITELAESVFARHWGPAQVRAGKAGSVDVSALHGALAQAGLLSITLPEDAGGGGGRLTDLGLVVEAAGGALCPTTVHTSLDFLHALEAFGLGDAATSREAVLQGTAVGTTALGNPDDALDTAPALSAERAGDGWRLDGRLRLVRNAGPAREVVVAARRPGSDGVLVAVVGLDASGVTARPRCTVTGEDQQDLEFSGVTLPASATADADPSRLATLARASLALQCTDLVGTARHALHLTTAYVKERHQFGRPLGAFQAVQHLVADMRMAVDAAGVLTGRALAVLSDGHDGVREVAMAKLVAGRAATFVTLTAHQLHGGIGLATQSDLHLWSERAKSFELLGGAQEVQAGRLARHLASTPAPPAGT